MSQKFQDTILSLEWIVMEATFELLSMDVKDREMGGVLGVSLSNEFSVRLKMEVALIELVTIWD
jgi:hypothetical protein